MSSPWAPAAGAATFTVSTLADTGAGSLRRAISDANQSPGPDRIVFSVAGRFQPRTLLPNVIDPLEIDGATAPGYGTTPVVIVDGSLIGNAYGTDANHGLQVDTTGCTLRALCVQKFWDAGILLRGGGQHVVEKCHLGTSSSGLDTLEAGSPTGNWFGLEVVDSRENVIRDNVLSGNGHSGVVLANSQAARTTGNVIKNNFIGTNLGGTSALGNHGWGVLVTIVATSLQAGASGNFVGDEFLICDRPCNVISGNGIRGVEIAYGGANNRVESSHIGVNRLGTGAIPNGAGGVYVENSPNNTIGGASPLQGNVISGNAGVGVTITHAWRTQGPAAAVEPASPEAGGADLVTVGFRGVTRLVSNRPGAPAGPDGPAADALVSLGLTAVPVTAAASGNAVENNVIGLDAGKTTTLGNTSDGVLVRDANGNTIGGAGRGNVIAGNLGNGVSLKSRSPLKTTASNAILGNSIGSTSAAVPNIGNSGHGIEVAAFPDSGARGASDNVIGGSSNVGGTGACTGPCNLVVRNSASGIRMASGSQRNTVQGNVIGLDPASGAAGNSNYGITIEDGSDHLIGGTAPGAGNIVSGNGSSGIRIWGGLGGAGTFGGSFRNRIEGNGIGTTLAMAPGPGNGTRAIEVVASTSGQPVEDNVIGTRCKPITGVGPDGNPCAAAANTITGSSRGVTVTGALAQRTTIRGNCFRNQSSIGIDLAPTGANDNDWDDADTGPNTLLNSPEIYAQVNGNGDYHYTGVVHGAANAVMTVSVYRMDRTPATSEESTQGCGLVQDLDVTLSATGTGVFSGQLSYSPTLFGVAVTCTDALGNTSEFSMVDRDGDGLCDRWEKSGIPMPGGGKYLLPGANYQKKNLYVEIDAMTGMYNPALKASAVAAFAAVPNASLRPANPDGSNGILLHLDESHLAEPVENWTGQDVFQKLRAFKQARFGTGAETASQKAAKAKAYRYAVFIGLFDAASTSGVADAVLGTPLGSGGADFIVSLGGWDDPLDLRAQAGTFMHELGHALGLDHGGSDDVNAKPNYPSVMNYTWQTPYGPPAGASASVRAIYQLWSANWRLDYSRADLAPLVENSDLVERAGIGMPYGSRYVPVGPDCGHPAGMAHMQPMRGPVDWNRDGDVKDINACADVNFVKVSASVVPSPGQVLNGWADWPNLWYLPAATTAWRGSPFSSAAHEPLRLTRAQSYPQELTRAMADSLSNLRFDCNGNDTPDDIEIELGLVADADANGIPDPCENVLLKKRWGETGVVLSDDLASGTLPVRVLGDGQGGAYVAWTTSAGGATPPQVVIQRVDSTGVRLWGAQGIVVRPSATWQQDPALAAAPRGGVFVAWRDLLDPYATPDAHTRVQWFSETGLARWPAGGMPVQSPIHNGNNQARIAPDDSGGVYVAWVGAPDDFSFTTAIRVQRLDSLGTPRWGGNGVTALGSFPLDQDEQWDVAIAPDDSGGVVLAWTDFLLPGDQRIVLQRMLPGGGRPWGDAGIVAVPDGTWQRRPLLTPGGEGGLILSFENKAPSGGPNGWRVRLQKATATSQTLWGSSGIAACESAGDQNRHVATGDGAGGIIVAWEDWRESDVGVYASRVLADGTMAWGSLGVAVAADSGQQVDPVIAPDGANGAYVAWLEDRFPPVRATWVDRDGYVLGPPAGIAPFGSRGAGAEDPMGFAADGHSGAIVALGPLTADQPFVAQRIGADFAALATVAVPGWRPPTVARLFAPWPNPTRGGSRIAFALSYPQPVTLEVFDVQGRRVRTLAKNHACAAGLHRFDWSGDAEAGQRASAGVYFVRLRTPAFSQTVRVVRLE